MLPRNTRQVVHQRGPPSASLLSPARTAACATRSRDRCETEAVVRNPQLRAARGTHRRRRAKRARGSGKMLRLTGRDLTLNCAGMPRRSFLQAGFLGLAGLSLADLLRIRSAQAAV